MSVREIEAKRIADKKALNSAIALVRREKNKSDLIKFKSIEESLTKWEDGDDFIGRGAFGKVTKMRYIGTPVAVKILTDGGNKEALKAEISRLEQLRHPNIVTMIANTGTHIVMEIFDGPLRRVNLNEMVFVGRECMRALAFMQGREYQEEHFQGIPDEDECLWHGDIKPDNILINRDYKGAITKVVLGDVGISRVCMNINRNDLPGTLGFIPYPASVELNSLTDLFALAVSLLQSHFHENVTAGYASIGDQKGMSDNTLEFAERLPSSIGIVIAQMLGAYKEGSRFNTSLRSRYILKLLAEWDKLVEINFVDTSPVFPINQDEDMDTFETSLIEL